MNLILKRSKFILFVILIICVSSKYCRRIKRIVGGIEAEKPPEDDPVVFVDENNRDSRVYGVRDPDKGFYVFKGIRFGEAPVGRHRFQRPRAVHLDGEYNATTWGPPCPQDSNGQTIGSEDCLFLNVFTPALPDSGDGYPVLIWIHGGGFRFGAACQYEMRNLIKKNMVVVSIQYRLGSLGFLSTGTGDLPGNNGMFDMILAVNWVKKYIGYFGGNPNKTVAFGHGSGASAALMLSLLKLTTNYFSGLIAMSGSMLSSFVIDKTPMITAKYIASNHDCPTDNNRDMIRCLQELPVSSLIDEDSKFAKVQTEALGFISAISSLLGPGPVIEGSDDSRSLPNFMTDSPENFLSLGKFPEIPLLTGIMKDETGGAISGDYKDEITNNLKTIPNYLNKKLITSLQDKISNFGNKSRQFVPDAFNKYLGIGEKNNALTSLKKITDTLNDAIFNTPAFLTANYWSKKAETFFYSFDYNNNRRSYGKLFLNGLPIVDSRSNKAGNLGHGDELGYVFRANDIFGKKIPSTRESPDEENVIETFTSMIAEFAKTGKPKTSTKFSNNDNSFVSITDKATTMKNFRFCEIGLWIGAVDRLNSASCSVLKVTTETVERLSTEIVGIVSSPVDTIENIGGQFIPKIVPNIPAGKEAINSSNPIKSTVSKIFPKIPSFGFLSP